MTLHTVDFKQCAGKKKRQQGIFSAISEVGFIFDRGVSPESHSGGKEAMIDVFCGAETELVVATLMPRR